jgi:hypothetical protein
VSRPGAPGPPEGRELPLAEFPLDSGPAPGTPGSETPVRGSGAPAAAPLAPRVMAATADLASAVLAVSLPIVGAALLRGSWPTAAGLLWAAAFALALSFAATVAALFLFGRTVGMVLAGLSVLPDESGRRPAVGQAVRRWLGTALSAAALGLPLLLTMRDAESPTLADRLSGRPLVEDDH